jgi:hypothetical protein
MTKRKSVNPDPQTVAPGKQYPGVHGKVVDWAEHKFEEGMLFIHVRFTDQTELCWTIRTASVIQVADLSDWKTGDFRQLWVYVQGESDWE